MKNWKFSDSKSLFVLLLLYCGIRLPIILSIYEPLSDDLYRGSLAKEFMEGLPCLGGQGLRLPLWDYVADSYGAGALLAGAWTTPFFAVFGDNVFALKLAPLCWQCLSLVAWFFVFRPHFSPRRTFVILLFMVFSPPAITEMGLFNNGYHFEMLLWMALSILLFRRILENGGPASRLGAVSPTRAPRPPSRLSPPFSSLFFLGLLGGFSSLLILTNFVTQAAILIYCLLYTGPLSKRKFFGFYSAGFLIGFSPWLIYNAATGWIGLGSLVYFFSPDKPLIHIAKNFLRLFLKPQAGFQGFFGFNELPQLIAKPFTFFYIVLYTLGFFRLLWKLKPLFTDRSVVYLTDWTCQHNKTVGRALSGYLLNYGFVSKIPVNRFDILRFGIFFQILLLSLVIVERWGMSRYYYLFPLVPFIGMTLQSGFENIFLRRAILAFIVLTGFVGNWVPVQWNQLGRTFKMQGYSYELFSAVLEAKFSYSFSLFEEKFKKVVERRPEEVQRELFQGLSETNRQLLYERLGKGR